ncbi:MAG: hypothetical protein LIO95_07780, partial [Clostridiales bacterium]|nr:hypothetical protein [Clostridiales bacterium]
FGASLCAFAGTRPAKSTDCNLFCCLRNKTPAEGFRSTLQRFCFLFLKEASGGVRRRLSLFVPFAQPCAPTPLRHL